MSVHPGCLTCSLCEDSEGGGFSSDNSAYALCFGCALLPEISSFLTRLSSFKSAKGKLIHWVGHGYILLPSFLFCPLLSTFPTSSLSRSLALSLSHSLALSLSRSLALSFSRSLALSLSRSLALSLSRSLALSLSRSLSLLLSLTLSLSRSLALSLSRSLALSLKLMICIYMYSCT